MINLNKIKGANILITGGLGFIGSNLAIKLANLGCKMTILDSLDKNCGGNIYNINDIKGSVKFEITDIAKNKQLHTFVSGKDIIFNLAGQVSHTQSLTDPYSDLNNNLSAHLALLEACRKANPQAAIIYSGSRSQYGRASNLPVKENHIMEPMDINGVNKLGAEMYHLLYSYLHGMNTCSLRLANIYGPRHQMKSPDGFINWFVRKAIDNSAIKIFGKGEPLRDALYVEDAVDAIISISLTKNFRGKAYNVASGKPISVGKIAEEIIRICGNGKIEFAEYPKDFEKVEIGDFYADINRIKKDTGWEPKTGFPEGIKQTIEFYNKNKKHYW